MPATVVNVQRPDGKGPFPAVVLLHGCGGARTVLPEWVNHLTHWGYVAVILDSFTSRGVTNACGGTSTVTFTQVADDAFAALDYLRTRPDIDPRRIGLIGFSFGGTPAIDVSSGSYQAAHHPGKEGFAASVSFYPLCTIRPDIVTPLLILQGDADAKASPAGNCNARVEQLATRGAPVRMMVFAGAGHSFDNGSVPAAANQAFEMVRGFLEQRVGGHR